jgi:hypothetical protein
MECTVRQVEYYYAMARDAPGEAYQLLSSLASSEVDLLAFNAIPMGPAQAQLTLFPEDPERLVRCAARLGIALTGPQRAFLVQGDDRLGAFASIHRQLYEAMINVYASSGVTDGRGGFGYVLYVRPEDFERAAQVLHLDSRPASGTR